MSTQDPNVPKRRSAAANRRRRKQRQVASVPVETQEASVQQPVAAPAAAAEPVDRNVQRREDRRAAKTAKQKKSVTSRVTENERFSGSKKFYHDTMSEIRKVNWPDRMQTRNLTLLVIALSTVMGALLGGIDFVLLKLFEAIG